MDFLKAVARRFRRKQLHVILDNSSGHTTRAVRHWLGENPRVHLHFTSQSASWLTLIEAWFGIPTPRSISRGCFHNVRALVPHIGLYIDHWNQNPHPSFGPKSQPRSSRRPFAVPVNSISVTERNTVRAGTCVGF